MGERVRITDVSPRDGLQNEAGVVATADKARLVELLCATGVDEVEVTSFVSAKWVPQLGDAKELLSMLASAAVCGLGVALMPAMLVQAELARNDLVILCNRPARSRRSYCFVSPESAEPATALSGFVEWLQDEIAADALCAPKHG